MVEWNVHGGLRGDGDGLKKYGKFIQQVKRMAAVVRELQRAFQCLRAASDIEMALLDASLHLYKRPCPSVGPLVRWSVGPSVGNAFVHIDEK